MSIGESRIRRDILHVLGIYPRTEAAWETIQADTTLHSIVKELFEDYILPHSQKREKIRQESGVMLPAPNVNIVSLFTLSSRHNPRTASYFVAKKTWWLSDQYWTRAVRRIIIETDFPAFAKHEITRDVFSSALTLLKYLVYIRNGGMEPAIVSQFGNSPKAQMHLLTVVYTDGR